MDTGLWVLDSLSDGVDVKQVGEDDRQPLEQNRGRAGVVEVLHPQHVSVEELRRLRQAQLEPGEQRRVVQGPLRRVLQTEPPG